MSKKTGIIVIILAAALLIWRSMRSSASNNPATTMINGMKYQTQVTAGVTYVLVKDIVGTQGTTWIPVSVLPAYLYPAGDWVSTFDNTTQPGKTGKGTLILSFSPANAIVTTPITGQINPGNSQLTPGSYSWHASAYGFDSQSGTFTIVAGKQTTLSIALSATQSSGGGGGGGGPFSCPVGTSLVNYNGQWICWPDNMPL